MLDKDLIMNGITAQLSHIDIIEWLRGKEYASMELNSHSDITKLKSKIKKDITARFKGFVAQLELNEYWLASVVDSETIEAIGKLPVASLKYLEDDLILALTNHCVNVLEPSIHLAPLPYNTSVNRFYILFLALSTHGTDVRDRFRVLWDRTKDDLYYMEAGRAHKNIQNTVVSDSDMKSMYRNMVKEIIGNTDNKLLNKALYKLIQLSFDSDRQRYFENLINSGPKSIRFISYDGDNFGTKKYTMCLICAGLGGTEYRDRETVYTDWELVTQIYMFSLVKRPNNTIGFMKDNIYIETDRICNNLSSKENMVKYDNAKNAFKAHMQSIDEAVNKLSKLHNVGEKANKKLHNNFLQAIIGS